MSEGYWPTPDDTGRWLRHGDSSGYDRHIDLLVEVWHSTDDERTEDRPLHDFLHMSWEQYQYYMSPGHPEGESDS